MSTLNMVLLSMILTVAQLYKLGKDILRQGLLRAPEPGNCKMKLWQTGRLKRVDRSPLYRRFLQPQRPQ